MNYKYIVFADAFGTYDTMYQDITKLENVQYIGNITNRNNFISNFIFKCAYSTKYRCAITIWLAKILNKFLFKSKFSNNAPICFMFFRNHLFLLEVGFIEYLQKEYKNAKFVCYYQDLVCNTRENIDYVKSKFDYILTYDVGDADKYDLIYRATPFSSVKITELDASYSSDIYFCGNARNRLNEILQAYDHFESKGYKLKFLINGGANRQLSPAQWHNIQHSNRLHGKSTLCLTNKSYPRGDTKELYGHNSKTLGGFDIQ